MRKMLLFLLSHSVVGLWNSMISIRFVFDSIRYDSFLALFMSSPLGNGLLCILLSCYSAACCLHIAAAIAVDMAVAITHCFIPLKSPATDIPQQQLSQREHASVSSRMFYAIEINQRQCPLFGFSFHCCCCFHFPLCVCYYRICVIYHKNYAVTITLRCSNVYNHVRISPALLSFLLAVSSSIKYAHRSAEWVSR